MEIWTVKLNPEGGIRKRGWQNKIPAVLEEEIKRLDTRQIKNEDAADYCKRNSIIGIGWSYEKDGKYTQPTSWEEYIRWARQKYKERSAGIIKDFHDIREGDICWTRDKHDVYYICKITGPWEYKYSAEALLFDLPQIHGCEWKRVGKVTEVPACIVRKLITRGGTVSKMKNIYLSGLSEFLINKPEGIIQNYIEEFRPEKVHWSEDFIWELDEYEYEDLVGIYLQQKYYLYPSIRTQSTKDYEFVLVSRDKEHYHTAVVQVKFHERNINESIDAIGYYQKLGSHDIIYLACPNGVKNIMPGGKIKEIKNDDLLHFWRENPLHLPGRIKFKVVYAAKKQEGKI